MLWVLIPLFIIIPRFIKSVLATIDFNGKLRLVTVEVENIRADGIGAANIKAKRFPIAQTNPQAGFRR